jgi:L-threonylcarbamoyladenylate synthase
MITKILKINPRKPEKYKIKIAARIIKSGGLVAFPTETVYGLGADVFNKKAVQKIFIAKGRPFDNPLIAHIADIRDLQKLAKKIPQKALILAKKFWPGPLTMVMEKSKNVPKIATAGLNTIAIRMPNNKIALKLIKASVAPIAAPSANTFTKPSPTSAKHVFDDLNKKISMIIDGGRTNIGLESTVVDLTSKVPEILRPGKITFEQLQSILGKIKVSQPTAGHPQGEKTPKSPGMKYKHYSPKAEVILVCGNKRKIKNKIQKIKNIYKKLKKKTAIIWADKNVKYLAKNLFKKFREFDNKRIDIIIVEGVKEKGLGLALMNRLKKAASEIIKV